MDNEIERNLQFTANSYQALKRPTLITYFKFIDDSIVGILRNSKYSSIDEDLFTIYISQTIYIYTYIYVFNSVVSCVHFKIHYYYYV